MAVSLFCAILFAFARAIADFICNLLDNVLAILYNIDS